MNESDFEARADALLQQIETALEKSDADFDFALISTGVLEIEFSDGSKIIVNRHVAAQEIWVAARSGGFHFRWDGQLWRNTRNHDELMSVLSTLISEQAGEEIKLC